MKLVSVIVPPVLCCPARFLGQLVPVLLRQDAGEVDAGQQAVREGIHCQRWQLRPSSHLQQEGRSHAILQNQFSEKLKYKKQCSIRFQQSRQHVSAWAEEGRYQRAPGPCVRDLADVICMPKRHIVGKVASQIARHKTQH